MKGIERVGVGVSHLHFTYGSRCSAIVFVVEDYSHFRKRLIVRIRLISKKLSVEVDIAVGCSHSAINDSICRNTQISLVGTASAILRKTEETDIIFSGLRLIVIFCGMEVSKSEVTVGYISFGNYIVFDPEYL